MIKKLVTHGNSAALIIDKPILQLLNVDTDSSFEITTDGRSLIISPVESDSVLMTSHSVVGVRMIFLALSTRFMFPP